MVARIRSHSECHGERWSTELYVVGRDRAGVNLKMREGFLDLKIRRAVVDGFEQWAPTQKADFPVTGAQARDALHPLGVGFSVVERAEYTIDEFTAELVDPHPFLTVVTVTKRRQSFTVDDCMTEVADVVISGTPLKTIAVESVDLDAARTTRGLLGLDRFENVSYPLHIKRMLGWNVGSAAPVR